MTALQSTGGFLGRLLQALGVNAVPIAGFFGQGWSQGTALAIYWVESVLVIVLISVRIALHRRLTRKTGHYRHFDPTYQAKDGRPAGASSLLNSYLGVAIPFTAVHGLFLGMLLFLFLPREFGPEAGVSLPDLGRGVTGVALFLVVGLLFDLVGLRDRSFRWLENTVGRALGRIFVVHMTILFGMFGAMFWNAPAALFAVFAGLKTLFDLGAVFPEAGTTLEPPRWLRFLDRVPGKSGETFSESWRRTELRARAVREENEQPFARG